MRAKRMDNPPKGIGPSDTSTNNTPTILTPTYPASSRASWMTQNPSLTDPSPSPEDRWREGIDPSKSSAADIITYTKWRMRGYEEEDLRGESLSEAFFVDFEHFDQETFKVCGTNTTRHLRDLLRERGIYARKAAVSDMTWHWRRQFGERSRGRRTIPNGPARHYGLPQKPSRERQRCRHHQHLDRQHRRKLARQDMPGKGACGSPYG
jgi:hypothetical protein